MKRKMIRFISLILVLVLCVPSFASCSGVNNKAVASFKGQEISCAIFQYLCSMEKTNYLYEAYGLDKSSVSSSQLQDNAAIWEAKAEDGSTVADTLKSQVLDEIKLFLFLADYAAEQGYVLGAKEKNLIKAQFDKNLAGFVDQKEFDTEMKKYGVSYKALLEYNYFQTLSYQGMELLFGENGSRRITDESVKKYYKDHYVTTLCVYINTKDKTYPNGKVVGLPKEEKEAKIALAESVYQKALAGEDFVFLVENYSEQGGDQETASAGYTFRKGGFVNAQAEEKAFSLKTGEIAKVETEGGVYILCKKSLDPDYFETAKASIRTELEEVKKYALVTEVEKEFKVNESFISSLDIALIPHVV